MTTWIFLRKLEYSPVRRFKYLPRKCKPTHGGQHLVGVNYAKGCTSTTVEWEQWALAESAESEEEDEIQVTNFKIPWLLKIRKNSRIFNS